MPKQQIILRPIDQMNLEELDTFLDLLKSGDISSNLTKKDQKMTEEFCYLSKLRLIYMQSVESYRKMLHYFAFYIRFIARTLNGFVEILPVPFAKDFVNERTNFLYDFVDKIQGDAEKFAIKIEKVCSKKTITKSTLNTTLKQVEDLEKSLALLLEDNKKDLRYYLFVDILFLITIPLAFITVFQFINNFL